MFNQVVHELREMFPAPLRANAPAAAVEVEADGGAAAEDAEGAGWGRGGAETGGREGGGRAAQAGGPSDDGNRVGEDTAPPQVGNIPVSRFELTVPFFDEFTQQRGKTAVVDVPLPGKDAWDEDFRGHNLQDAANLYCRQNPQLGQSCVRQVLLATNRDAFVKRAGPGVVVGIRGHGPDPRKTEYLVDEL